MIRKLARRLAWAVFVVWATVTLAFLVNYALPSDPARMVAGPQARPQDVARIRADLGLDRSLTVQYARFLGRLVHLGPSGESAPDPKGANKEHATCAALVWRFHVDLGKSYQQRRPVVTILAERIPRTLLLAIAAAIVQIAFGVTAGVIAAARKRTAIDHLAVSASLLGISAPTFVIGLFFQWLFAYRLRLLPLDGYGDTFGDHVASVVLPALTLGVFGAAYYTRMVRDEMIGQLGQDYVRTAFAKGLPEGRVVYVHALRNSLIPLLVGIGHALGLLFAGSFLIEKTCNINGFGLLGYTSLVERDYPVLMGVLVFLEIIGLFGNIISDIILALVDPRVRFK